MSVSDKPENSEPEQVLSWEVGEFRVHPKVLNKAARPSDGSIS